MKYLFVMTTSSNVINFRADLIRFLIEKGHEVSVIAHDDERKGDVLNLGVSAFYCAKQDNRSLNPFSILTYQKTLKEIISKEKPDYLFTYQLKPNVFGTIAGKKTGVKNVYSFVEGLGDVYVNSGLKWKLIRFVVSRLYKRGFKACKKVFFLNNDDKDASVSFPADGTYKKTLSGGNIKAENGRITLTVSGNSGEILVPENGTAKDFTPVEIEIKIPEKTENKTETKTESPKEMKTEEKPDAVPEAVKIPDKPYEEMTVEELQAVIIAKMAKNGPVTEQMKNDVTDNIWHNSLVNWAKSFR